MSSLLTIHYDHDTGRSIKVDLRTGEVEEYQNMDVPLGATITTEKQREAQRKYFDEQQRRAAQIEAIRKLGKFCFVSSSYPIDGISPASVARLIFLGTYIPKGGGILMKTKYKPLFESDLPNLMHLSRQTVSAFLKEANKYITVKENGTLLLDDEIFIHGTIKEKRTKDFQRIYIENVRKLYQSVRIHEHRYLGYIFKTLPYLNTEYNALCWNPEETDPKRIAWITTKEFCDLCGYSQDQASRLKKAYSKIKLDVDGVQQYFCTFLVNGPDDTEAKIVVNPNVVYRGSHYDRVMILGYAARCSTPSTTLDKA